MSTASLCIVSPIERVAHFGSGGPSTIARDLDCTLAVVAADPLEILSVVFQARGNVRARS